MHDAQNGWERSNKEINIRRNIKQLPLSEAERELYETCRSQMSRQPYLSLHLRVRGILQLSIVTQPEYRLNVPSNLSFPDEIARGDRCLRPGSRPDRRLPPFDSPESDDRSKQQNPTCLHVCVRVFTKMEKRKSSVSVGGFCDDRRSVLHGLRCPYRRS